MRKVKFKIMFTVMLCVFLYTSCSFQNDSFNVKMRIKDISRDTDYERVVTQGFMGGSLIYRYFSF